MQSERENLSSLTPKDFDIAGNEFRAYYDNANNLVFVVDSTLDDRKPNVLLVINPSGDRKWDDVLVNDYGVDLETVRPKKDNKYQKLDIEYSGLSEYDDLIHQYISGGDLSGALAALSEFRDASVRRAASERLAAATETADKSRDTIIKTNQTISELQTRIKKLRSKLSQQKKSVGKEPTKQSAAKILRTESQIDATNEKLRRAKKRLTNAQRRLVAADEDAQVARTILERNPQSATAAPHHAARKSALPAARPPHDLVAREIAPVPAKTEPEFTEIITEQPKAEVMADEEVKPLFDKDPEILDEEIAFKPIEFDVPNPSPTPTTNINDVVASDVFEQATPSPLSFTPPVSNNSSAANKPIEVRPISGVPDAPAQTQPVLDTITSVEAPNPEIVATPQPEFTSQSRPAPVMPDVPGTSYNANNAEPEISPAPLSSDFRPVSPISGTSVSATEPAQRKPTLIYYIMLILLIVLSIFTLWLYQRSSADNVPDLTTVASTENAMPTAVVATGTDTPFIAPVNENNADEITETVQIIPPTPISQPEPVVMPEPEPEPVQVSAQVAESVSVVAPQPVSQPEPVVVPEPEPEPVAVMVEPEPVESPFITAPEPVATPAEPVVNKPAYNVSQQENMFVAAPDYETDATYYSDTQYDEPAETCDGGALPNANGCCPGEIFTDMEDGTFACCTSDGVECFPPMQ